jgi:pimeloyl-ACP methyl ester carboxylesterase
LHGNTERLHKLWKMKTIQHTRMIVNNTPIHLAQAGNNNGQAILLLHGYPENCMAFEQVIGLLKDAYHVLAIDLPGIGGSGTIDSSDKKTIAGLVSSLIRQLGLKNVILAGHDVGGMVAYSLLRYFPENLSKVIIMNTAIPGVDPWEKVKGNPHLWHFAFYSVPFLPETLVAGNQRALFDYFYDNLSVDKNTISENKRDLYVASYLDPACLATSFDWYRAFPRDENDNAGYKPVDIPVLYIRGEKDSGNIQQYLDGLNKSGIKHVTGKLIPGSLHFSPEESPQELVREIEHFICG